MSAPTIAGRPWRPIDNTWFATVHRVRREQPDPDWQPRSKPLAPDEPLHPAARAIMGGRGAQPHEVLTWVPEDLVHGFVQARGWGEQGRQRQERAGIALLGLTLDAIDAAFSEATLADALGWAYLFAHESRTAPRPYPADRDSSGFAYVIKLVRAGVKPTDWPLSAAGLTPQEIVAAREAETTSRHEALTLAALRGTPVPLM